MLEDSTIAYDRPDSELSQPECHWIQLNVGLVRQAGDALASARHLFASITPHTVEWREAGCLQNFFFMRKPPDVRLRFLLTESERAVVTLIEQMSELQAQGLIREFFFSDYQPELDLFGGRAAMECVHHYFDQDTSLWLMYDRLCQQRSISPPEMFLPLVFHDLFSRTLGDPYLALKAWRILGALIPVSPTAIVPQIELISLAEFCKRPAISIEEVHLMHKFADANEQFAGLLSLVDANQLTCDLCKVLAAIAMFNFNRYGFSGDRSSPLVAACQLNYTVHGIVSGA